VGTAASAPLAMLEGKMNAQRLVAAKSVSENRSNNDIETSVLSMFLTSIVHTKCVIWKINTRAAHFKANTASGASFNMPSPRHCH
jgi:hypothetical protein